jgi:glyoxylase-like metal-dependent hydrolase (beta-lactamase superfamily II)
MASQRMDWKKRYENAEWPFDENDTVFLPVRHFNSATPITPGPYQSVAYNIAERPLHYPYGGGVKLLPSLIGGGYFLGHKGKGIAIDPGYEFVDVVHRYHGVTVSHIHTVVITHDHMDHHADLETILNLRIGATNEPLKIIANKEVIDVYGLDRRKSVKGENINVIKVSPGFDNVKLTDGVNAKILPCMHWQRVRTVERNKKGQLQIEKMLEKHLNAFGLQLTIDTDEKEEEKKRILITGDTLFPIRKTSDCDDWVAYGSRKFPYSDSKNGIKLGWSNAELQKSKFQLNKAIRAHCNKMLQSYRTLDKSDIVCLHLGSLEKGFANNPIMPPHHMIPPEKTIIDHRHEPAFCYQGFHLGLMGSLRVLEVLSENDKKGFDPETGLVVLTEFGEELIGNRQNLCVILEKLADLLPGWEKSNPSVIPSEVTLLILIENKPKKKNPGVLCSYCNTFHDWKEAVGVEGPGEIITYLFKGATKGTHPNCAFPSQL